MSGLSVKGRSQAARCVLMLFGLCVGAEVFAGPSLQVVMSNGPTTAIGGQYPPVLLYGVTGVPASPVLSTTLATFNCPAGFCSFVSLAYVPSNSVADTYDVIAADDRGSGTKIWRFFGGTNAPAPTQIWSYPCDGCTGPQQALKVAVDGDGTLYVLSSDQILGASFGPTLELWAFPKVLNPPGSGFATSPILIDAWVAGFGPNANHDRRDYSANNIHAEPSGEYAVPSYGSQKTITLRSGDPNITFLTRVPGEGSIGPFAPDDFASAINGPQAAIVTPLDINNQPVWLKSTSNQLLSSDSLAQWIAVDANRSAKSALYALPFNVLSPITSASMTMNFAVDNNLGESLGNTGQGALASTADVPGLYVNGNALADTNGLPPLNDGSAFFYEHVYQNGNIGPLLTPGKNTLFFYQFDWGYAAGSIFSATINVSSVFQNVDMIVAPAGVAPPLSAGDVLVMFGGLGTTASHQPVIADYNASQLQTFIQNVIRKVPYPSQCPLNVATCTGVNPRTVLNSDDLPFASGEAARSLAVWPKDSHVMLMTTTDVNTLSAFPIYKFTWSSLGSNTYGVQTDSAQLDHKFATNIASSCSLMQGDPAQSVPCEPTTLRTGVLSGTSYAFVTAPAQVSPGSNLVTSPSQLLELTETSGVLSVTASSALESDGALNGLAVQATGTGTAAGCISGCAITVGDNHTITGTTTAINAVNALPANQATISETVCKVAKDPRKICGGTITTDPNYNANELPVKSVCPDSPSHPSFGNTKIPDYICGYYGPSGYGGPLDPPGGGTGFVLILGRADGLDAIPGLFIKNDVDPTRFFGTPNPPGPPIPAPAPACPQSSLPPSAARQAVPDVFGWAPWTGSTVEGVIPEGLNMTELTWGCGGGTGHSSGLSLTMVGGRLDLTHATRELGPNPTVNSFLKFATYKYANLGVEVLAGNISTPQKARLAQLIAKSAVFLASGGATNQDCAANKLWSADRYVTNNASKFFGTPGIDPNPYGRIRSRLANLFYVVFSEIEGQPPPVTWPALPAPGYSAPGTLCPTAYLDADGY
jgi:hypothetical protein